MMKETVNCRVIDMASYPRREHFEYFMSMENPFITMTVQVDITDWLHRLKETGYPLFLCFQYAVTRAANRIPEFRQRIRDRGIVEYKFCNPSYTVALPDGTYRYCLVNADQPLEKYISEANRKQEKAIREEHLREEGDPQNLLFISCVPWVSYSSCTMPFPDPLFSIPNIVWGKYRTESVLRLEDGAPVEKDKITIPVTVLVHHALADGRHVAQFYSNLEEELEDMHFRAGIQF